MGLALQQKQCPSQPPALPTPAPAPLVITTDVLPHGKLGHGHAAHVRASGGRPPYYVAHRERSAAAGPTLAPTRAI